MPIYDVIGQSYSKSRIADPRIVDSLLNLLALEKGSVVADIGAGTGNYSRAIADRGFLVYAVEPSDVMHSQATPHPQVRWRLGYAEAIPLPNSSVDAVLCVLAMHHFSNLETAFREMDRVARKGAIVFLTFDPRLGENFWLYDYFPFIREYDKRFFPSLDTIVALIQTITKRIEVSTLMLPSDLTDMFLAAGWKRPEIYLNPEVRASMSAFALAEYSVVQQGLNLLEADLKNGKWEGKYKNIINLQQIDLGYRLLRVTLIN